MEVHPFHKVHSYYTHAGAAKQGGPWSNRPTRKQILCRQPTGLPKSGGEYRTRVEKEQVGTGLTVDRQKISFQLVGRNMPNSPPLTKAFEDFTMTVNPCSAQCIVTLFRGQARALIGTAAFRGHRFAMLRFQRLWIRSVISVQLFQVLVLSACSKYHSFGRTGA